MRQIRIKEEQRSLAALLSFCYEVSVFDHLLYLRLRMNTRIDVMAAARSSEVSSRRQIVEYVFFILMVLVPGFFEENVSWEGHLGGLLGGLIAGIVMLWIKYRGVER